VRILIDNRAKKVSIDGVAFPVASPALDAAIDYVTWADDGIGTIQYAGHLLRANFLDVSPYQPFVNAWITAAAGALTLAQARAIKAEFIATIASYKRQRPVTATAGGASRTWDGGDIALAHYGLLAGVGAAAQVAVNATNAINGLAAAQHNPDNPDPPPTLNISGPSMAVQVCPLGSSTVLTLTPTEMQGIAAACAGQRAAIASVSQAKQDAVNVLGTVAAVVGYDATAGW
jgi:hypothetical protein